MFGKIMPIISIIDNEPLDNRIIEVACANLGITCYSTVSADQFLSSIDSSVELVILDLLMPFVDGAVLLRKLKEIQYSGSVAFISGAQLRSVEIAMDLAKEHGFKVVGHILKPVKSEALNKILLSVLDSANVGKHIATPTTLPPVPPEIIVEAFKDNLFVTYFQPQIDIKSGKIHGFEALVRLDHPSLGFIAPDRFISKLEETQEIDELFKVVLNDVLKAKIEIQSWGLKDFTMSINVSVSSLSNLSLPDVIKEAVDQHLIEARSLVLEITESERMTDLHAQKEVLLRFVLNDHQVSIDDFGTGHAMFEQLEKLPATELKIDKRFVGSVIDSHSAQAIVRNTIKLAHDLKLKVVAEGVESEEQVELLNLMGCDIVQGFFFSKALSIANLKNWLVSKQHISNRP